MSDQIHTLYKKTLKTVEFHKILELVKNFALCEQTKENIEGLCPGTGLDQVRLSLLHTGDAKDMLYRRANPPIGAVKNMLGAVDRAKKGSALSCRELLDTARILKTARLLISYFEEDKAETSLDSLFLSLEGNKYLEDRIFSAILSEDEIADSASPGLLDIRRKIRQVNAKIREVLNKLIGSPTYQKYLQDPIITMRGDRYVVPVKAEHKGDVPGLIHDTSASGATIFIEPMASVEANNELKILLSKEKEEIERILYELSADVGEASDTIVGDYRVIIELDFIFAKAKFAREYKCVNPKINEEGYIHLRRARHPLIDPALVVPIDVSLGRDFDVLVITGPNTGGKTVTLKTIGLFCAMAASGLQICADEGSEVAVFEKIFADIGDEQSIEQSLSTFSSHMKTIVEITKNVGFGTLALFDELGAGTDPTEGAALAISILEYVKKRGAVCAATTHYSELKIYALSSDKVENASCEFDIETLQPTYRLVLGIPGKSNAFAISKRLGLPEEIIENSKGRITKDWTKFEQIISSLDITRKKMEDSLSEAESLRERSRLDFESVSKGRKEWEASKEKIMAQAKNEAKRILSQAKASYDLVLSELEELKKQKESDQLAQNLKKAKSRIRDILQAGEEDAGIGNELVPVNPDPGRDIKAGDTVMLLNLNKPAEVLSPPDKDGNMMVQAGIVKIKVHKNYVRVCEEPAENKFRGTVRSGIDRKNMAVRRELDVRGQDSQEAIFNLEKFIDDAVISGLNEVTVIHGKGTGVLRSAVHAWLKGNKNIKNFRLGSFGEGETGVTVITLQ